MTEAPQLRSLGHPLGIEVLGGERAKLDDATSAWITRAFAEHPVPVFRQQYPAAAELAAFGRRFGTPRVHSLVHYRMYVPDASAAAKLENLHRITEEIALHIT